MPFMRGSRCCWCLRSASIRVAGDLSLFRDEDPVVSSEPLVRSEAESWPSGVGGRDAARPASPPALSPVMLSAGGCGGQVEISFCWSWQPDTRWLLELVTAPGLRFEFAALQTGIVSAAVGPGLDENGVKAMGVEEADKMEEHRPDAEMPRASVAGEGGTPQGRRQMPPAQPFFRGKCSGLDLLLCLGFEERVNGILLTFVGVEVTVTARTAGTEVVTEPRRGPAAVESRGTACSGAQTRSGTGDGGERAGSAGCSSVRFWLTHGTQAFAIKHHGNGADLVHRDDVDP
ncbi:hypothetical protein H920_12951 [Fukomys damarensis]|uniref:Uncharacterized protein n=1 Tax=Fukomys damarensis TaxID=885580 RepID=A0A091D3S8_FUKDA|nr:hypothetical protein H920_12951 [Fukomys damarensis]